MILQESSTRKGGFCLVQESCENLPFCGSCVRNSSCGWGGGRCAILASENSLQPLSTCCGINCSGHGVCKRSGDGTRNLCVCMPTYSGPSCSVQVLGPERVYVIVSSTFFGVAALTFTAEYCFNTSKVCYGVCFRKRWLVPRLPLLWFLLCAGQSSSLFCIVLKQKRFVLSLLPV